MRTARESGIAVRRFETPLGPVEATASERGVRSLTFADGGGGEGFAAPSEVLERLGEELAAYFAGELREFGVPLDLEGTAFRRAVWDRLLAIPYGRTTSYDAIALELGRPGGQRAVGQANGANPIAIVVPCHRVLAKGGGIGGYGGGLERKRFLLALEAGGAGAWAGEAGELFAGAAR